MNSEERLALAQKGIEPYASRYGYTARPEQAKKRKKARKFVVTLKVIGLLGLFAGTVFVLLNQYSNISNQINNIPNAYLGALVLLIYIAAFLVFIVMVPLKIIELAFNLPGLHIAKDGELDNKDGKDYPETNPASGLRMFDGSAFDTGGNLYGFGEEYGSGEKYDA